MNPDIDRQEMRNYLLGTLDEDRRTQFEERILSEPSVYDELLVAEEELIDQYVAGDLSEFDQKQFETHFLITAERQKNLRFGKLLQRYVDSGAGKICDTSSETTVRPLFLITANTCSQTVGAGIFGCNRGLRRSNSGWLVWKQERS